MKNVPSMVAGSRSPWSAVHLMLMAPFVPSTLSTCSVPLLDVTSWNVTTPSPFLSRMGGETGALDVAKFVPAENPLTLSGVNRFTETTALFSHSAYASRTTVVPGSGVGVGVTVGVRVGVGVPVGDGLAVGVGVGARFG
ncbi:MAG: hypothetical protein FJ317_01270 [SAR202 cluster bacterium]|nr:hypothetical protein [SAR202 cluster bacterium]